MPGKHPAVRQTDIVIQELEDEILIYDLLANKAFCLNETSALVYRLCDGNRSVSDISQILSRRIRQPVSEDFVWLALYGLQRENLLAGNFIMQTEFKGLSRRELVRRVGLASTFALPIILSLIAPTAAQAQSCVNPGGLSPGSFTGTVCGPGNPCDVYCASLGSFCCSGFAEALSCPPPSDPTDFCCFCV
jgi:hypothetical protein